MPQSTRWAIDNVCIHVISMYMCRDACIIQGGKYIIVLPRPHMCEDGVE